MLFKSKLDNKNITLMVDRGHINSKNETVLLRITIDDKLTFKKLRWNIDGIASDGLRA